MTIDKILKAYNFLANAKYLRKDFIVPKFTGTEPDIEQDKLEEYLKNEKEKNKRSK
jgi:hypothetical protein